MNCIGQECLVVEVCNSIRRKSRNSDVNNTKHWKGEGVSEPRTASNDEQPIQNRGLTNNNNVRLALTC